ncbi:alpha/beta fold hydrolase [Rheinheimera sp. F8]|uniref:alpha/beta fold hydrolase n=1 Tax=Rheinheimera sp. F8 TaxID=1763998 RepID=UPI000744C87D|nr:alpha/beta fold hydrolase [Rheinheimera sp. F8]ALZ76216.1 esterase [Rheinheimera sp. F8]ALZ77603.1 esterase [Rheinheimera sp. F8]
MKHQQHSIYLDQGVYQLHVKALVPHHASATPVLMLHGAIENGRIFYSQSGKGLGCFLADQGFSVYCADFAGRGLSRPHVSSGFDQNQHQLICQDIPALIEDIYARHQQKVSIVCHSWGGVVALAALARQPELLAKVRAIVCFGSKRRISVRSWRKSLQVDWVWNKFCPWLAGKRGYLPARQWKLGADDEPVQFLRDTIHWIRQPHFVDPTDNFDYSAAAQQLHWPPAMFFAAVNDLVLGHATDVKLLMQETGLHQAQYRLLGKAQGDALDYDHISMLTSAKARTGHFAELAEWLKLPG